MARRRRDRSEEGGRHAHRVEVQSGKYAQGLPDALPAWRRPLPFLYESTGAETTSPTVWIPSRAPATCSPSTSRDAADWLKDLPQLTVLTVGKSSSGVEARFAPATFIARARHMPRSSKPARLQALAAQTIAIQNLEKSLAANKPRALIQMATGSGKTSPPSVSSTA